MNLQLDKTEAQRLAELEVTIAKTRDAFRSGGAALAEIRDRKLYREKYKSFEAYCEEVWQLSRRRAYQLIEASEIVESLPPKSQKLLTKESHAAALSDVPKERHEQVLHAAAKNGEVTAKAIEQAAKFIPEPDEYVDAMGYPIPDAVTKFWDMADEIKSLRNELRRIKALIVAAAEANPKMFVESNVQAITIHLQNAFSDLGNSIPYAVCPSCQAQNAGKCQLCRGRGLISKFRWNVTVPEELKTLRQKQIQKLAK